MFRSVSAFLQFNRSGKGYTGFDLQGGMWWKLFGIFLNTNWLSGSSLFWKEKEIYVKLEVEIKRRRYCLHFCFCFKKEL